MSTVRDVPATVELETIHGREAMLLAPYAMHSERSAGRKYPEAAHAYRGPYVRDRDRIVHSAAYRRLSGKTQVFMGEMGDYHRTRLTHTLEVAFIARTVGRVLRLNEDLIEALALAHDLGHPPFGHAGEDTLDACLAQHGGFNHNRQALRIVEELECRYRQFPGLNLTLEVLEGQQTRAEKSSENRSSGQTPLLEVQVVDAADSVAYDTHDADDALELGLLDLGELLELPLWREAARRACRAFSDLRDLELRRAAVRELIDWQVGDLLSSARQRFASGGLDSISQVRAAGILILPSPELAEPKIALERFLHQRVYRHPHVLAMRVKAQQSLQEMFLGYLARPDLLPSKFQARAEQDGLPRSIADYLAGMTDRFAEQQYRQLIDRADPRKLPEA
jgi:dGTPase